jgi:ABC-type transport system involved in multi-copper enzyme maturation permease subunit
MLLGPVFRAELLRTARRRRYYLLRFVYGLILFWLVWASYEFRFGGRETIKISELSAFASETFTRFGILQLVTVLVLVPPLFGGTITDEKQRRTLHYLMASRLSSGEIILDKLLARSAHLAVFVAMGLPVVAIIGFLGGISLEWVALAYLGTLSTTTMAVAISVWISTRARRVRQAVLVAYLLILAWIFVPTMISGLSLALYPGAARWVTPVADLMASTSPVGVLFLLVRRGAGIPAPAVVFDDCMWMAGLQVVATIALLVAAIMRLRPIFRRQEETPARTTWFRPRKARMPRRAHPECGNDPLAWKERYFAPADIFTKLVLLPALVAVTIPLILSVEITGGFGEFCYDVWNHGFAIRAESRWQLAWGLQVYLGWYIGFWLLAVAGASAASVAQEREADTWVSLTSSPLTGWEILRGKAAGAIWNQRGFAAVIVGLWLAGVASTALRPGDVLISVAYVILSTWMVTALGIHASLRAQTTSRALVTTIMLLAVLNGYPFVIASLFIGKVYWESSFLVLGAMPWLAVSPFITPQPDRTSWNMRSVGDRLTLTDSFSITTLALVLVAAYGAITALLTWRVIGQFDVWLDRPRLRETLLVRHAEAQATASAEVEEAVMA